MKKPKLIRLTTVPISMNIILRGQLAFMNNYFEVIGVTGRDEKHFEECGKREGIRMHAVQMSRTIALLSDLRALWLLYIFFKKEKPAIVHTHTPKAGLLGMVAAYFARVPIRLHTVGGMPLTEAQGMKRKILKMMERVTYACAHRVYPNSFGLMEIIKSLNLCDPDKLKVIANGGSNGINTDHFVSSFSADRDLRIASERSKLGIEKDAIVFCFVGRIAREKGIVELVHAFLRLRDAERSRKMKLLLIGPFEKTYGVLGEETKALIAGDSDIVAPGRFDDVRPYYLLSDVYVFPSYREGFPNTVLEAGAMSLPSIVSDINGCNEIVQDGVSGRVIPVKDTDALYHAMRGMLDDQTRHLFGSNARAIIVSKFGREVIWNSLRSEYQTFLKEESRAAIQV